jgi:DNA-binding transcriptional LysR family regulator
MDSVQWDNVRYFLALSRQGSLSATARALKVEHSTVARRVSSLEESLSIKLFDRLARGWVLTAEGQELAKQATLLEEEMLSLWRAAMGNSSLAGTVRLSAPPLLLNEFLVPRLNEFARKFAEIDLVLIGETRGADLARGEADIALRMVAPTNSQLVTRRLGDVAYNLYAVRRWHEVDESEQAFIGFDDGTQSAQKAWLDNHVGERRFSLRTNDMRAMYHAAAGGLGIAFLPQFLAGTDPRLEPMPGPATPFTCPLFLVMHGDMRRAPRIRATADFLVELFQEASGKL